MLLFRAARDAVPLPQAYLTVEFGTGSGGACRYGRGVMLQIFVDDVDAIAATLAALNISLYAGPREVWRRYGDREGGKREILLLDPNGYLVMLAHDLGERPIAV